MARRRPPKPVPSGPSGRNIAIAVVAVVSCLSFALGYFVGSATRGNAFEIVSYSPPPEAESYGPEALPEEDKTEEPEAIPWPLEPQTGPVKPMIALDEAVKATPVKPGVTLEEEKSGPPEKPEEKETGAEYKKKDKITYKHKAAYSVQVGAFTSPGDADALKKKLKGRGFTVYVFRSGTDGDGAPYKVRVGKFADRKTSDLFVVRLRKTLGLNGYVIRVQ
jgi:cell division protein FtsN